MAIERASLTGLILAGGRSSRMQGPARAQAADVPADAGHVHDARHARGAPSWIPAGEGVVDKGLLLLNGHTLAYHAWRFLAPQVERVLVSANRCQDRYARYGRVIADDPALGADLGPLAGIEAALRAMATPWLLVMPVDVCAVPTDLGARLAETVESAGALAAYACTRGAGDERKVHPLCMLAHASLAGGLRQYLLGGGRKVQRWHQRIGAAAVVFGGGDQAFFNVNTPEDLVQASQYCKS